MYRRERLRLSEEERHKMTVKTVLNSGSRNFNVRIGSEIFRDIRANSPEDAAWKVDLLILNKPEQECGKASSLVKDTETNEVFTINENEQ